MIIEKLIISHMNGEMDVPVVMERDGETAPFVLIERTGGSRKNRIEAAIFAVQSYGRTMLEACELNDAAKAAVYAMRELDAVCGVDLSSDYNFTDTSTKEYRYQALFNIRYLMEE